MKKTKEKDKLVEKIWKINVFSFKIKVFEAPKSASRRIEDYGKEDEFGAKDFSKELALKPDHSNRPLWIVRAKKNLIIFYSCFVWSCVLFHEQN
jgi:hypothetical protein